MVALKKHYKGLFICLLGALFYCYEYLLRIIPGVIQPELRVAYGNISATTFGTLTALYYFAYTPTQLPAGILLDRFGSHKLLTFACFSCTVGAFLFADVSSIYLASIGRLLVGFGSAFAFVGILRLANSWLPKRYLSVVAGVVTSLGMIGAILGQVGMTQLVGRFGYQFVLWLSAIIGVVVTSLVFLFVKDNDEYKSLEPAVPFGLFFKQVLEIFKSFQVWIIGVVGCLMYLSLSIFAEVWGKSYLMIVHHLSPSTAALSISFVFFGWALGAPFWGLISEKTNRPVDILFLGAIFATLSITLILFISTMSSSWLNFLMFLYGFFSSTEVLVFVLARDIAKPHLVGSILAVVNMIIMVGGIIFQPLVGKLLDIFWDGRMMGMVRYYSIEDYQLVLAFLPLSTVIVAILVFFINHKEN